MKHMPHPTFVYDWSKRRRPPKPQLSRRKDGSYSVWYYAKSPSRRLVWCASSPCRRGSDIREGADQ